MGETEKSDVTGCDMIERLNEGITKIKIYCKKSNGHGKAIALDRYCFIWYVLTELAW